MTQMKQKSNKRLSRRQLEFIQIFENQMCLITAACRASKVSRAMYYRWLEQPLFKERIEDTKTGVKDFGEQALIKLIKDGSPAATIFFNKCRNKDRGYVEKQEVQHLGVDNSINVIIPKEVAELLKEE